MLQGMGNLFFGMVVMCGRFAEIIIVYAVYRGLLLFLYRLGLFFKFFIEWFFNQPHFFGFKYSYYSSSQCLGTDVWRSSYTCMLNVSYRVPARSSAL